MNISTTTLAVSLPTELLNRVKQIAALQNSPLDNVIAALLEKAVHAQTQVGAKP